MAKKNIELLKRLRTRFMKMRHPQHFDMSAVARRTDCGTAMCIAGHTLELAGYQKRFVGSVWESADGLGDHNWYTPSGKLVDDTMQSAKRLLGLTRDEALKDTSLNDDENGLFMRFDLKTPKQAAAEIQKLIDEAA